MKFEKEPAYILHVKPHLDKTRLVSALTLNHGWLRVVARLSTRFMGVPVEPFMPVRLSCRGTGAMPGIRAYEVLARSKLRDARAQMLGMYLNELVMKMMAPQVPCAELFHAYENSLSRIGKNPDDEWSLRRFEVAVLEAAGHGLNLAHDTEGHALEAGQHYAYDPENGARPCAPGGEAIDGAVFKCLSDADTDNAANNAECTRAARRFMRRMIDYHLQGKDVGTRRLFQYLEGL